MGKTTLALMVCADRRVKATIQLFRVRDNHGREMQGAAAIAEVNEVIKLVTGEDSAFTDLTCGPAAGYANETGPRRLLDYWTISGHQSSWPIYGGGRDAPAWLLHELRGFWGAAYRECGQNVIQSRLGGC